MQIGPQDILYPKAHLPFPYATHLPHLTRLPHMQPNLRAKTALPGTMPSAAGPAMTRGASHPNFNAAAHVGMLQLSPSACALVVVDVVYGVGVVRCCYMV